MRVPVPASALVDHPVRRAALAGRFRAPALLVVVALVVAVAVVGLLRSRATAPSPTYSTVTTTLGDVGLSVSATGPRRGPYLRAAQLQGRRTRSRDPG